VEVEGERRYLNVEQVFALQYGQDRPLRETSLQGLLQGLSRQGVIFKHILNSLLLDDHLENLRRGYPSSMHRVMFSHQVDKALIEAMMEEVERHYPLAHRYLHIRGRAMGLEKLKITDLSAPLRNGGIQMSLSKARHLLLQAAKELHPVFYTLLSQLFEKGWIDAELTADKRDGAFCKCFAPSLHPFVSINYSGSLRAVSILAHELGHGIHYSLCAGQSYLNFRPSPVLAEAASTFVEIILTQFLMKRREFQAHLAALLASHLEGILTTVYRQNMVTRFEQAIHRLRPDHLLSEEEICQLWWEANEALFGGHVVMIPPYRWGWTHIPHIFRSPFYCYSYVFGNLLSMILYQNYREKGEDFLESIMLLFSSGSNQAPAKILETIGLRPTNKAFWDPAFDYIEGLINAFETFSKRL
jgi:oligoendopeptidase F